MDALKQLPTVSVVIPAYNAGAFIRQAVESVLTQTYPHFEIIIVNDGSTDDTREKVQAYTAVPNVKYIEQRNRGTAIARNVGIEHSVGELIAFLDHDDWWLPEKLESQVQFLRAHPTIAWVHTNVQADVNGTRKEIESHKPVQGDCFKELFKRNRIILSTVMVRRICLDRVGSFDSRFPGVEDYHLWLRIASRFPLGYVDRVLAIYRMHESNMSSDSFKMTKADLSVIDSILQECPSIDELVSSSDVRQRVGALAYELGGWYMWRSRDYRQAKEMFLRSIQTRPGHLASYREFFWCSLTADGRQTLAWYWHKLKGQLARRTNLRS